MNDKPRKQVWTGLGHFLEGLVFPARPVDMIRHAERKRRQERLHEELVERLNKLPEREYRNADEIRRELGADD